MTAGPQARNAHLDGGKTRVRPWAESSGLRVLLTGRVAAEANGRVVDERRLPGRQGRLLFVYLVAAQSRPVPRDQLADAIWGESPPATWEKALAVIVSKLRGLLADDGVVLTHAFGCYRLDLPEGAWVRHHRCCGGCRGGGARARGRRGGRGEGRCRVGGLSLERPFLPGEDGLWVAAEATRAHGDPWSRRECAGRVVPVFG